GRSSPAVDRERTAAPIAPSAVAIDVAIVAGDLALHDDALSHRAVPVLDEIDDRVDGFGVNIALPQHQLLLDDGVVVLDRADVAGLVLVDDQVIGLDHAF